MDQNTARGYPIDDEAGQIEQEVARFFEQRPIFIAIWKRFDELGREVLELPKDSPDRRTLKQRIRKLEAYISPRLYGKPKSEQDRFIRSFAQSLLMGEFTLKGRVLTLEEVKELTDKVTKGIRKRPVGNQVVYRHRITEAYEIKLANPTRPWTAIASELEIEHEDLVRQIRLLKRLLKTEGISLPSQ